LTAWAVLVAAPATAHAHLASTGLGPLYDGIAHLLLSFDDLLPVTALALLAGLNGAGAGRRVLFALPLAWLAGGVAGLLVARVVPPDGVTAVSLLVLGGLTAASARLSPGWATVLAAALGLLHGGLNGASIAAAEREASALAGIAGAVFVVVALAAAIAVSLHAAWARVAVRVAGGWIAAIGLLMLGWVLRAAAA
jgi:hydrogenase/urease accessory protein HupE